MSDLKRKPVIVIYLTKRGVERVQVHSPTQASEQEGITLYGLVRPLIDRLDQMARDGGGMMRLGLPDPMAEGARTGPVREAERGKP